MSIDESASIPIKELKDNPVSFQVVLTRKIVIGFLLCLVHLGLLLVLTHLLLNEIHLVIVPLSFRCISLLLLLSLPFLDLGLLYSMSLLLLGSRLITNLFGLVTYLLFSYGL